MKSLSQNERRQFLASGFIWILGGTAALFAGLFSKLGGLLFSGFLFESGKAFKAGKPEDFKIGTVDARWKDQFGVWLIRTLDGMYALSAACTASHKKLHWNEAEQRFECSCHGAAFYKSGVHFEGPKVPSLERFRVTRAEDGQVWVDKGVSFKLEKGEWNNAGSFLSLAR